MKAIRAFIVEYALNAVCAIALIVIGVSLFLPHPYSYFGYASAALLFVVFILLSRLME